MPRAKRHQLLHIRADPFRVDLVQDLRQLRVGQLRRVRRALLFGRPGVDGAEVAGEGDGAGVCDSSGAESARERRLDCMEGVDVEEVGEEGEREGERAGEWKHHFLFFLGRL